MTTKGHDDTLKAQLAGIVSFKPCTQPKRGRYGSHVTKFASRKTNTSVICESLLEAAFCLELEQRHDVAYYEVHPFTMCFTGTKYRYTPDFLVQFVSGETKLIEVKNDSSFADTTITTRIMRYVELLADGGCALEYLSAAHFYQKARTQNLMQLYHRAHWSDGRANAAIHTALAQHTSCRKRIEWLIDRGFKTEDIAHALFYRAIRADLRRPLSLITRVWSHP